MARGSEERKIPGNKLTRKGGKVFYGWVITAASIVVLAAGIGMYSSTNGLFVIPVCETLGISRGQYSVHRTLITIVSAFAMPFYGKLIRRLGVRNMLLIGSAALGIVTGCYSMAQSIWHLYLLAALNGIFVNAISFMVIGMLISEWFVGRRGFATGLAFSGSGLGGALSIPAVNRVIELYGWRAAYVFIGALGLIILVPVILALIKNNPQMAGLSPYELTDREKSRIRSAGAPERDLPLGAALKTGRFWLLAVAFFLISCLCNVTIAHSAPFLQDTGYTAAAASAAVSFYMASLSAGKILLGFVYDRFGVMSGNAVIAACCLVFPVAALLAHIPALPWIYAMTAGIASSGFSVPVPILIIKYFGARDYPMIFSAMTMVTTAGSAVSVPAMGAVYDYAGSYQPAWFALLAFSVIIAISMFLAELKNRAPAKHDVAA